MTTEFVLQGKTDKLARLAAASGLAFESLRVESGVDPAQIAGADLVILDTPRPNDLAKVQGAVGPLLAAGTVPWLRVGGGPPAFGNLPPPQARSLMGYYAAGGQANFVALFAAIGNWRSGGDLAGPPAPSPLPPSGIYHPDAPRAFESVDAYLAWGRSRWAENAPRMAVVTYPGLISGMETAVLDDLVRRAETAGVVPIPFWSPSSDPAGIEPWVAGSKADVLVVATHLQNGTARAAEFLKLGIPVIHTVGFRDGGRSKWEQATSGITPQMVAPFLAVPEGWGASDPMVIEALENGEPVPLSEQVNALVAKAKRLAVLRHKPAPEKRVALLFWNYPPGEKNLAASNLNLPRSLERFTRALADAGYDVPSTTEAALIEAGQTMLGAVYHPARLEELEAQGLVAALPLDRYRVWFDSLPTDQRAEIVGRWGEPEAHAALRSMGGAKAFLLPRLRLGKLELMPQLPRGGRPGENYHDAKVPPDHLYLAQYLYLRELSGADALINFGTHGTQEWTPGKDRGLSLRDYPYLTVGDLPVFYPYIQDNVGEAVQAKRRGRAVTISHQTPPFAPAGLYDELRDLHTLVHEYQQMEGGVAQDATAARIRGAVTASNMQRDMGWDEARMEAEFPAFLNALHDHLHRLAEHAMPLGLHTFGEPATPEHRLATVMQQLGPPFYRKLGGDPDEFLAVEAKALASSPPYCLLHEHLRDGRPTSEIADPALRADIERAADFDRHLAKTGETEALLAGLAGRFVGPGPGGDPIRNPEVPSGRNLFPFEPDKVPTRSAYEAGAAALGQLIDAHKAAHGGAAPRKLAFSLWSSETMRHLGVLEAQVLHALGLRPVWNDGGRVVRLDIIPAAELGRPRIDAVLQVTSLYRDQFDGFMRLLADAIERLAALEEPGNPVAANSRLIADKLIAAGRPRSEAARLAALRLFSNEPGDYATGLPGAVLNSTTWEKEAPLAESFLTRMQYGYGSRDWGIAAGSANLFAEQLRGTDAAVLARSSTLHGLLSTDHAYEYLGGLSLAVRHLGGPNPSLYVADLRSRVSRVASAASFLSDEMRTRTLNPAWINGQKGEGYAGTLEVLAQVNNLWGWQVTDPGTVRADQWQAVHDTFVRDIRQLDLNRWFETHNPTAQAQMLERMVEAIRKNYWNASAQTRRELAERWDQLKEAGIEVGAPATREFVAAMTAGFGVTGGGSMPSNEFAEASPPPASPEPDGAAPTTVSGPVLTSVAAPRAEETPWSASILALLALACLMAGAAHQFRANARAQSQFGVPV